MATTLVDLSHAIEHGQVTYRGLPAPSISAFLTREASRAHYAPGTEFYIARIDMVANTGTYLDSPFHRYPDGADLAELELRQLADLEGVVIRARGRAGRAVERERFEGRDIRGKAVLVDTGWDTHWGTERYFEGNPFLPAAAVTWLVNAGAALVGIDSLNIDDTTDPERPAHSGLLAAGIPIVEHLTGLERLPDAGFRFFAVPPRVRRFPTFPVRAFARLGA